MTNGSFNGNFHGSSSSNSFTDGGFNSSMHIKRMFNETPDIVNILSLSQRIRRRKKNVSFLLDE